MLFFSSRTIKQLFAVFSNGFTYQMNKIKHQQLFNNSRNNVFYQLNKLTSMFTPPCVQLLSRSRELLRRLELGRGQTGRRRSCKAGHTEQRR